MSLAIGPVSPVSTIERSMRERCGWRFRSGPITLRRSQMLDEATSFASVARKIGNGRLEKALRELASQVEIEIRNAKSRPLRAEVRNDVKRLKPASHGWCHLHL